MGRFNGYVAQYQGDGVVVYFGWPRALGDDAGGRPGNYRRDQPFGGRPLCHRTARAAALQGSRAEVEVFRVVRVTGVRSRLHAARTLTPFVGREAELRTLEQWYDLAERGAGR